MTRTKKSILAVLFLVGATHANAATVTMDQTYNSVITNAQNANRFVQTGSNNFSTISTFYKFTDAETFNFNYFDSSLGTLTAVQLFASGRLTNKHISSGSCVSGFSAICASTIANTSTTLFDIDLGATGGSVTGPPDTATSPLNFAGELTRGFQNDSTFNVIGALFPTAEDQYRIANYSVSRSLDQVGPISNFVAAGTFSTQVTLGVQGTTESSCLSNFSLQVCQSTTEFEAGNNMNITLRYIYDDSVIPVPPTPQPGVVPLPASGLLLVGGIGALGLARRRRRA